MKRFFKLSMFPCVVVAVLVALFLKTGGAEAAPNSGAPPFKTLSGIAAVSSNDVWAVGNYLIAGGPILSLIEHWNGSSWSVVANPNPGSSFNSLNGLAVISASNIWAVGAFTDSSIPAEQTLIEHWNGKKWSVVNSPSPGSTMNALSAVAVVSASDIWSVGNSSSNNGPQQPLIEHWNGSSWSVVPSPSFSARSAVPQAGGGPYRLLVSVAAISSNDVWTVGSYFTGSGPVLSLIEHWNGSSWSAIANPNPGSSLNFLQGVAAVSSKNVWAVGGDFSSSLPQPALIEHWNGSSWSVVPNPSSGSNSYNLNGVAVASASNIWAVGAFSPSSGSGQALTEHWNGSSWSIVSSPNVGLGTNQLNAVTQVPVTDDACQCDDEGARQAWAVGFFVDSSGAQQPLIEHWNGKTWNIVQSAL